MYEILGLFFFIFLPIKNTDLLYLNQRNVSHSHCNVPTDCLTKNIDFKWAQPGVFLFIFVLFHMTNIAQIWL